MELPFTKIHKVSKYINIIATLLAVMLIFLIVTRSNYPILNYISSISYKNPAKSVPSYNLEDNYKISDNQEICDIFTGEWVPDPNAPYYTNTTCKWGIHEHQNCMKYGRPDSEFLKWRWKPNGCELPVFDPYKFLDMVRNKSMAFVGDSVGRNQMQSMICLLSKVEYPIDVSPTSDEQFKRWKYVNYNFTLAYYWAPFLVQFNEQSSDGPTHTGLFNLYLDEPDESWATKIDDFDYIILNSGHWFPRTAVYHEHRHIVGCRYCQLPNITDLPMSYGLRRAFRAAFKAINERANFKGITFLRTYAPSHFENGLWSEGGNCMRRRPFRSYETVLAGVNLDVHTIQLEEFRVAQKQGKGKKKFRVMEITQAMLLRPDGHPSIYGHRPEENVTLYNDCVHWCLPGPIDSWTDFFMHMMKMEHR